MRAHEPCPLHGAFGQRQRTGGEGGGRPLREGVDDRRRSQFQYTTTLHYTTYVCSPLCVSSHRQPQPPGHSFELPSFEVRGVVRVCRRRVTLRLRRTALSDSVLLCGGEWN